MFLRIITRQATHQWGIALLIFLAMTALVTLYVYSNNTTQFANRSMQVTMKNMGHNLLIIPKKSDPQSIYCCADDQVSSSDKTTRRMSKALDLSSTLTTSPSYVPRSLRRSAPVYPISASANVSYSALVSLD